MATATLTLIPDYVQIVIDNSANTATLQTYDSSNKTWNTQATLDVSNGQMTVNQFVGDFYGVQKMPSGLEITGTGGPNNAAIDLTSLNSSSPYLDEYGNITFPSTVPSGTNWGVVDKNTKVVIRAYSDGTLVLKSANNTLDTGDGNRATNPTETTLAGTTAGNVYWIQPERGTRKVFTAVFDAYENDTTTNQTITFPVAYKYTPTVAANNTGLTISASTTTLTITSPDSTTTYSGVVEVIGI